ncbi:mechanosensitive ion channel family protein [Syntrophotalea carbinolica]|nr:mechanosensitive ion channel domain-containing protein [Syntrophotalea carbinolica]
MAKPAGCLLLLLSAVYGGMTLLLMLARKVADRTWPGSGDLIRLYGTRPLRILAMLGALGMVLPVMGWPSDLVGLLRHVLALGMIGVCAWLLINTTLAGRTLVLRRYDVTVADNLKARVMMTQVTMLFRVVWVIICILAVACMLMTFERIRQLGISLLASAGLIGIVAGFAAQKSLATLVAGIQLAITQPIRLDDVVVIEGEWGRIEEITLTYVVVRIWDERRLVVPITQFLEQPFQNWTRTSAQILGTVFLWADYTIPIAALRKELKRVCESSPLWDGRVCLLQVTDAGERTLQLRALVSASDSGKCWDLRCEVREKLVDYVQRYYPEALPRWRAKLDLVDSAGPVQNE